MAGRGRLEVTHTQVALWDRRPLVDVVRDETESTPLWLLAYSINAVTPEDDVGQHTYRYLKKRAVTSRVQTGRRMNKQEGIYSLSLHLLFAQIVPCLSGLLRENFTLTTIASRGNSGGKRESQFSQGWLATTHASFTYYSSRTSYSLSV